MIGGYNSYGVATIDGKRSVSSRGSDASDRRFGVFASLEGGSGGNGRVGGATAMKGNYEQGVMEGTIDVLNRKAIIAMCRDMYLSDTIAGAAIDLMSNLPFSDFTLSGVNDKKILESYIKNVENLRLRTFFPAMSIDYLTDGAHQSSLEWDQGKGMFTKIIPHDGRFIEPTQVPIHGADPLLTLQLSDAMSKLIAAAEKDPRARKIVSELPALFRSAGGKKGGKAAEIFLEQSSTLYIARKTFSWNSVGVSYLYRVLPIWIMEKALIRGTIESVYQRQRAILHITAGDGAEYEPSNEDLNSIANLFKMANMDPLGAIVATRQDININEVVRGDDFWKWTDSNDQFAAAKLKALGLSDSFLSGDASFATLDANLSVFVEQLRAFREMTTREFFYEKVFPIIAYSNNFKKSKRDIRVTSGLSPYDRTEWGDRGTRIMSRPMRGGGQITGEREFIALSDGSSVHDISQIEDITDYYIPTVDWHKQLAPTGDQAYLDMLNSMMEKGIPIPIRTIAAAGGQNLDKIMSQVDDDMETRQELSQYNKKIKKYLPKDDDGFGGGGGNGEFSSFGSRSVRLPPKRQFTEQAQEQFRVREHDSRGKVRYVARAAYQRALEQRQNKKIAESLARISEENAARAKRGLPPKSLSRAARRSNPFGRT